MNPQRSALVALLKLSDLGVVAATFVVALAAATPGDGNWFTILEMRVAVGNVIFMAGYLGFWHLVLRSFGLYRSYRLSPNSREWRDLGAAVLVSTVPLWALVEPLHFQFAAPTFLATFTPLAWCGLGTERRLFRMLTGFLSELPPFLTRHSGLDSGYMLLQYTAAALVTDNQLLSTPASVHSLPTSADQEDHNSMGWHSAQRAHQVATNTQTILALEALGAAQGIDLLAPLKPGRLTGAAHAAIRAQVPYLDHDRVLEPEIRTAVELIRSGGLAKMAPA